MKHSLSLIVAMDRNRLIGADGNLPWHLPDDLKWFKRCTRGKPIVMGRHTWHSLGGALPDRPNIVLTSQTDFEAPGATVAHSLENALESLATDQEIMIIGGGALFGATLDHAEHIYLTVVQAEYSGDTWFPTFDTSDWRQTYREDHPADDRHAAAFSFLIWERVSA